MRKGTNRKAVRSGSVDTEKRNIIVRATPALIERLDRLAAADHNRSRSSMGEILLEEGISRRK